MSVEFSDLVCAEDLSLGDIAARLLQSRGDAIFSSPSEVSAVREVVNGNPDMGDERIWFVGLGRSGGFFVAGKPLFKRFDASECQDGHLRKHPAGPRAARHARTVQRS